jgi:DNA replication and repair protein RecF
LDGREIRAFGSSGQQRSALLILDLAAISLYNLAADDHPVFLIDDVDAELDEKRITHLLEYLENRTQTFITTSKRNHVEGSFQGRMSMKLRRVESEAVRAETDLASTSSIRA